MSDLRDRLADYLGLRRSLGYKLERASELLADFVDYTEGVGDQKITTERAVAWAILPVNAGMVWRAQRLAVVRGFARYLQVFDPDTEVPPRGLLPARRERPAPFLFSDDHVAALIVATKGYGSAMRSTTLATVIGLLASTGLRVGETIRLDRQDVDVDARLLTVRNSKLGKSRLVPLHETAVVPLDLYAAERDKLCPRGTPSYFVSTTGTRLLSGNLRTAFNDLLQRAGLPSRSRSGGPRLGDLRHTFAVNALLGWYRSGADVEVHLPLLSRYLGHVSPASTYWYLSAAPELLAAAASRLDSTLGEMP